MLSKSDCYDCIILTDLIGPFRIRPIGAYRIATELRKCDFSVKVIHSVTDFTLEQLLSLLEKFIGESTLFFRNSRLLLHKYKTNEGASFPGRGGNLENFEAAVTFFKRKYPKLIIVVGGSQSLNHKYSYSDYRIVGFADNEIVEFAKQLRGKETTSQKNLPLQ